MKKHRDDSEMKEMRKILHLRDFMDSKENNEWVLNKAGVKSLNC